MLYDCVSQDRERKHLPRVYRLGVTPGILAEGLFSEPGARASAANPARPFFRFYSAYLLDFLPVFGGWAWRFALPERFAPPVCTTVVELPPPVAFAAAPNAAPAAMPFATG